MSVFHEDDYCDWCGAYTTNPRSLVMGYNGQTGMGECICENCLNKEVSGLYLVKRSGRQIFGKPDYYHKNWKNHSKVKVLRTPSDHQEMIARRDSEDEYSTSTDSTISE
mmetsp:Transcript_15576/g.38416  ORF Transcript_15576/g.38416 Transcript_15576/m.38416 type:complete len:109 (-) Transcript_15576:217-543(-)|eukprot:CAMPEP_0113622796 /NCGR_PEP_ID=MMETSP0017_2-20120614/11700_1 /TAXON_ID=2856 /ORGANISM="Cylindrotheca closterium" /LENGTH=108 /DNA_ID=CAMNT_0000532673 /DNA_START=199 /DNA_END=525 /DNA_ORIENTATION=+ /assembly_acc=CAM_ASM_000147